MTNLTLPPPSIPTKKQRICFRYVALKKEVSPMSNYQREWRPTQQPQQGYAQQYAAPRQYPPSYSYPIQNYVAPVQPASQNTMVNVGRAERGRSFFDGGLLSSIGLNIINVIIIVFTLGLGTPWALCRKYAWTQKHTVIEGRRLRFNGTAGGLFGLWIKWYLLSLITLGIYAFRVSIDLQKWIVKHTSFAN